MSRKGPDFDPLEGSYIVVIVAIGVIFTLGFVVGALIF